MTNPQRESAGSPEDGWTKLVVVMSAEELRRFGPTLDIQMWPVGDPGSAIPVTTLVDTGANRSCISAAAARKLRLRPSGLLRQHAAGSEPQEVPHFRCGFEMPSVRGEADFAILSSLGRPHDALIGRDIMAYTRLVVDFTTGIWQLHWKTKGR